MLVWALVAGVVIVLVATLLLAPARTTIIIDTPASAARAEMRLLWGVGPKLMANALPTSQVGNPLALFHDTVRIGHALMTPGIADASYVALKRLFQLGPRVARLELGLNLGDSAQNLVVQTAAQAALAAAPAAMRDRLIVTKCAAPGAELTANFELTASPIQLAQIYGQLKDSGPVREFRRRLKRRAKPTKRPPREVRTS